jgi:hypothetical protein
MGGMVLTKVFKKKLTIQNLQNDHGWMAKNTKLLALMKSSKGVDIAGFRQYCNCYFR